MKRTELLAALEAATGPSRELDEAIYKHIGYWWDEGESEWCEPNSAVTVGTNVPLFTSSLDAALTLVPEGCDFIKFVSDPSGCGWEIGTYHLSHPDPDKIYQKCGEGSSDGQFAIALCIAALRARGEGDGR